MFLDDIIEKHKEVIVGGIRLNDAIVIKTPSEVMSDRDLSKLRKIYYKWSDIYKSETENTKELVTGDHFTQFSAFDFELARLPFDNVVFDCNEFLLWIFKRDKPFGAKLNKNELHEVVFDAGNTDPSKFFLDSQEMFIKTSDKIGTHEYDEIINKCNSQYKEDNRFFYYTIVPIYKMYNCIANMRIDFEQSKSNYTVDASRVYFKSIDGIPKPTPIYIKINQFQWVYIVLKMCMLIHCKNVKLENQVIPDKLQQARKKRGKLPLITHKIILIKHVFGKKGERKELWTNRFHIMMGHFKTYTTEAPLFGKFTGKWWWEPMSRGRNKAGQIIKDYYQMSDELLKK